MLRYTIAEEKGVGAQVLFDAGLTIEGARAEVQRLLGPSTEPARDPAVAVVAVKVEIRRADQSVVREEFPSVPAAMSFLRRAG